MPAAFASAPDTLRTSQRYVFISTQQLVNALIEADFQPTAARQARAGVSVAHARHMIRFTHVRESVTLVDAIPEIILINAHDGSSAYTLRAGLYRPVCTNGLMTQIGEFGLIHVPHRGNVIADVVDGALRIMRGFGEVGAIVKRMHRHQLDERQRWDLAAHALKLRYHLPDRHPPIAADALLLPRRPQDFGNSLWQTFNVIQENLLSGGIQGHTAQGRRTRTRGIRAIREDVRLNLALWQQAMSMLHA